MKPLFVTGIGTGIGKTIVSAILVEALRADYWKPVQSGDLDDSDSKKVKSLVSNTETCFHPERFRLTQPFSPHKSAKLDGIEIKLEDFKLPLTENALIIEGAGGLMVPLNQKDTITDLIQRLEAEVILVSRNYLGSINHTLLSINELSRRRIPVKALIFNGPTDSYSEEFIIDNSEIEQILRIPEIDEVNKTMVAKLASAINLSI